MTVRPDPQTVGPHRHERTLLWLGLGLPRYYAVMTLISGCGMRREEHSVLAAMCPGWLRNGLPASVARRDSPC